MNALYIHRAREYFDLVDKNMYGRLFVEWTHPDIPMWGAELILNEDGNFIDVGKNCYKRIRSIYSWKITNGEE